MPVMEGLIKLVDMWEIQVLVLLSFALQIFLFFAGSLRQHSKSLFLRLSIWAAYLGAYFVAVYTLGLVLRHEDITVERRITGVTQSLAFFWAPFLLIHLGGQDTITAFSMEDNRLWLRHLMNLVVQVILSVYVFWKSIGRHRVELLVSGVFVFVVGFIKYVERIWSLKCGCLRSIESSTEDRYEKLPRPSTEAHWEDDTDEESNSDVKSEINVSIDDGYDGIVYIALCLMPHAHNIFSRCGIMSSATFKPTMLLDDGKKVIKIVRIILSVFYADLYTKAVVVRTRSGIILRCIYQMSYLVAFVVFHSTDKQRYKKIDTAITYFLFVGGFFLEVCAMFIFMMSPWTWVWLKVREWNKLGKLSWFIFSSDIGWPEEKQFFTKSMGQYVLSSCVSGSGRARTFNQQVMTMIKWFVDLVHVERKKIFWMSKLLDTESVDMDEMTMECVIKEITHLKIQDPIGSSSEWTNFFGESPDFGANIVVLHALTEKHLSKYPPCGPPDMKANTVGVGMNVREVCRKLSNYMMYLLATHPSMLPLSTSAEATLNKVQDRELLEDMTQQAETRFKLTSEVLEVELVHVWARLLIYAAGKSTGDMHVAQLSRGGEFITFVWLLMALHDIGDSNFSQIRLTHVATWAGMLYAFPVDAATPWEEDNSSSNESANG